jgi:hypothetical protein
MFALLADTITLLLYVNTFLPIFAVSMALFSAGVVINCQTATFVYVLGCGQQVTVNPKGRGMSQT